jgi:hypothetical protein
VPASTFFEAGQSPVIGNVLATYVLLPCLIFVCVIGVAFAISRCVAARLAGRPLEQENLLEEPRLERPIPEGG